MAEFAAPPETGPDRSGGRTVSPSEVNVAACMVYVTTKDADEARRIGRALVESRLAACVNLVESIESLFWWEGAAQSENEAAFTAKTTRERFPELMAKVRELHSYEVPCVVALPIVDGNPNFLAWIEEETRPGKRE